jgi:hypothetical protein
MHSDFSSWIILSYFFFLTQDRDPGVPADRSQDPDRQQRADDPARAQHDPARGPADRDPSREARRDPRADHRLGRDPDHRRGRDPDLRRRSRARDRRRRHAHDPDRRPRENPDRRRRCMNLTNIKYKNKIIYNKNDKTEGNQCYNTGLTFPLCIQLKIVPYLYMLIILPVVKVPFVLF